MSLKADYIHADRSYQVSSPHALYPSYNNMTPRDQSICYDNYTQYADTPTSRPRLSTINQPQPTAQFQTPTMTTSCNENPSPSGPLQDFFASTLPRNGTWPQYRALNSRERQIRSNFGAGSEDRPKYPSTNAIAGPKRKRVAFVKDEELNCMVEDRAGTPHISELRYDEEVMASLNVEELGLAGAAEALCGSEWSMVEVQEVA
jgi:hypothetical protein